ncbi:DUF3775 domain-containing protein [Mameliella sp. AT18]|uniref:DUF3775 domain-containing protein n=1 Tax=Mameliella sp. AT18 TaxID=3028385 RepID=UPI00237BD32B|nr:DUF3775 domain-containing protein [Mameliella sp. AT18]MDD9731294.1 DUF3775 domain-containing protein [Mameliella sp. AT18]
MENLTGRLAESDALDDVPDLRVPQRTVCFIVELAHDLMGKTASTAAEDTTDDANPEADLLEDRGNDPVEQELRTLIDDLDEEAQTDLVALMWLGRAEGDWSEVRALAEQEHTAHTADYLLGTPLLADLLLCGLEQLGLDCASE